MPAARPTRLLSLALVWGATVVLAGFTVGGFAGTARADCQPDAPANNDTVTCSADDTDGFDAGAAVDLEVTVEGTATVDDGGADANAITLNDGNTVTVEAGAVITADGAGSHGIVIGDDNNSDTTANGTDDGVTNAGEITVTGAGAGGILGGARNDVTNDGEINAGVAASMSGSTFGIRVGDDGQVTNSDTGTITATGEGAVGLEVGNDTGGPDEVLTNAGTVTVAGEDGGAVGLLAGDDYTIVNTGTVNASGDEDSMGSEPVGGILGGARSDVTNEGQINAGVFGSGADDVFGIRVGDDSQVTNSETGIIAATGEGSVGIEVGDDTGGAAEVLTNEGSVAVTGENGAATGLRVGTGYEVMNSGSVTVTGDQDVMGAEPVVGVELGGGNTLTNEGTIQANSSLADEGGTGVRVIGNGVDTTITNENGGIIRVNLVDLDENPMAIQGNAIEGSGDVENVFNRGSITGNIDLGGGDDSLTLFTGSITNGDLDGGTGTGDSLTLDGPVSATGTNFGALDVDTVTGFEMLTIDALETFDVDDGMGGTTPEDFLGEWALLRQEGAPGMITLDDGLHLLNGTLQLGDTITVDGATGYVQDGSTLRMFVNPQVDPMDDVHGTLRVTGGGDIDLSAADNVLEVVFAAPVPTSRNLVLLEAMGGGSVMGTFETVPLDTPLLDFEVVYLPGTVRLDITRTSYTAFANTPNQNAAASYLDRVIATGGNDLLLAESLVELDTLSAAQLGPAYDAFHPEGYDIHTSAVAKLGLSFARAATQPRLNCKPAFFGLDPGPLRDVPCGRTGFTAWMNLLFSEFDREPGNDFFESEGSTRAVAGGFDWRPDRRVQLTGYIGIGSADLDVDGVGDGDVQSFEIGVAAHARLGNARLRGAFGYGRGEHEQSRSIRIGTINLVTESEFESDRLQGLIDLAWLFEWRGFQVEPRASMDVVWVQEEEFEESDTLGLQLAVDERVNTIVSTEFGSRFRYRHYQSPYKDSGLPYTQGTWTPEISAAWRSTWVGADRELDSRLAGAASAAGSVTADAEDNEQGAAVGARVTFQPHGSGGSVSVGYDGFFGDKGTTHRFDAKLEVYF